ncbi:permease-like cell division protein FtsX [Brevibacillus humidisoli]|uniref:permease-like cell division protein FtsX n=1 Tax=Brevibacillus humidisoli TaxID=2895522 RepID=UPI001E497912|nr:permease-like cell division protein FtsX [Brevibacillus humidisoli]UFJ40006.1 permease-like cell division protein FtsX [Brevibacillus humidisoli]
MKLRTLGRHVREGAKNISRNGWMTFASVSAVTITLLILGVFLLLAMNVDYIAKTVEKQVEINVTLDLLAEKADIDQVERQIRSLPNVDSVTFVPKEQGLKELQESFKDQAYLLDGLEEENPLPDKFVVKAKKPQDTTAIAARINEFDHVDEVIYGEGHVEKLFAVTDIVRNVGLVFIILLSFTAMFLIANTIKLTIVARRREIEIMKLVGATNWFIRWPFFVEGLIMGISGALIPIILLSVGYHFLLQAAMSTPLFADTLLPLFPLVYEIALLLVSIGAFIGIWGSLVSVRRFLRV